MKIFLLGMLIRVLQYIVFALHTEYNRLSGMTLS